MIRKMVTTERSSTLGYQNKLKLLQQILMLYVNSIPLEINYLYNPSEQHDEGWNIPPGNVFSGRYTSCGRKTQTDSEVTDYLKNF